MGMHAMKAKSLAELEKKVNSSKKVVKKSNKAK